MKTLSLAGAILFGTAPLLAQPSPLFPSPLLVEHHAVQTSGGADEFRSDPVTDYYTGSWIVSTRASGDRTVIDLARRELTEIQTSKGTYWTLTFSRMAELRSRLKKAHSPNASAPTSKRDVGAVSGAATSAPRKPAVRVEELSGASVPSRSARSTAGGGAGTLADKPGVRHVRAHAEGRTGGVEVWADRRVRLSKEARTALLGFETEALGVPAPDGDVSHAELMSAARDATEGAFPVRTHRRVGRDGSETELEDVVTRLEPITSVPPKLLSIPETFRRIPSPLEAMVSFAEEEAARSSTALKKGTN
jgi:hypothetical protein